MMMFSLIGLSTKNIDKFPYKEYNRVNRHKKGPTTLVKLEDDWKVVFFYTLHKLYFG